MTTPDAVARLNQQNDDVVIVRVNGSVRFLRIPPELQGKLGYWDGDQMLDAAVAKARELKASS
jgi:hypothetical protein